MVYGIIVDRLLELYDPFDVLLGDQGYDVFDRFESIVIPVTCCLDGMPEDATHVQHVGRICYFRNRFLAGTKVDPVEIDNDFDRYGSFMGVTVTDGHHRFCGAVVAEIDKLEATYGGLIDWLEWLTGDRDHRPL